MGWKKLFKWFSNLYIKIVHAILLMVRSIFEKNTPVAVFVYSVYPGNQKMFCVNGKK